MINTIDYNNKIAQMLSFILEKYENINTNTTLRNKIIIITSILFLITIYFLTISNKINENRLLKSLINNEIHNNIYLPYIERSLFYDLMLKTKGISPDEIDTYMKKITNLQKANNLIKELNSNNMNNCEFNLINESLHLRRSSRLNNKNK